MAEFITRQEAAELFKDGNTVASTCFTLGGWPEDVARAVVERFQETGHPKNMRHIHAAGLGNWEGRGEDIWAVPGLVDRLITSHPGSAPHRLEMILNNEVKAWTLPLGVMLQNYREIARHSPGLLSKVGLGTFVDARVNGGKQNQLTKDEGEDLVEYVPDFQGDEYLLFKPWKIDIGLMRGTTADTNGNITCENESVNLELLAVAQAVKACGGKVIVGVENVVEVGQLNPRLVKVPGIYVDYVVVCEDYDKYYMQTGDTHFRRDYTPGFRVPVEESHEHMPLNGIKVMCRRAAMELRPGMKANFGIGNPQAIGNVLAEEGCDNILSVISESGSIGGIPQSGKSFGTHVDVEASCDQCDHFYFFDGGNLDIGIYGLSESDEHGSINTTRLNGSLQGIGGFINITSTAKTNIFIGTFTAKGIKTKVENGKLEIVHEGQYPKFKKSCVELAYNADQSYKMGHRSLYITERCVLEKTAEGLVLTEVAPGIDIQKDILDHMEFKPIIPEGGPKLMPAEIFMEEWGGLEDYITSHASAQPAVLH
ncbi:MAG: acylcoa--acetate/3-ketoacidcoatransferase [Clostridia bacterium]|nr:acylcoa--acetate/3-ketoacidcoatransferase [Clostridia bacterium]